jgi:antitoxin (DNA-binding transcriptional repressor) of toxin-antitoxin stability system
VTQATIHQAKTHLSKPIRKALAGEEVVIAKRDKPIVRLESVKPQKPAGKRPPGWVAGTGFYMAEDFNEPLEDFEGYNVHGQGTRRPAREKEKVKLLLATSCTLASPLGGRSRSKSVNHKPSSHCRRGRGAD